MLTYGANSRHQRLLARDSADEFYNSGDTLSVSGAGGADLPSFAAQTLVAPNELVLSAPVCASPLDGGACMHRR
jgi:hypothetical protein